MIKIDICDFPIDFIIEIGKQVRNDKFQITQVSKVIYIVHKETAFYFKAWVEAPNTAKLHYCPTSRMNVEESLDVVEFCKINERILQWLDICEEYVKIDQVFTNMHIEPYIAELEEKFQLLDEDKNEVPFGIEQQIKIIESYEAIKKKISVLEIDKDLKTEYINEINIYQNNISLETKNTTYQNILRLISKLYLKAKPLSKHLIYEMASEALKQVLF